MALPLLLAGGSLAAKGLSSLFGAKSKKKQQEAQRKAQIAGLELGQKQGERSRLGKLDLAKSLLGGVPNRTYEGVGGGSFNIQPNVALDPELAARLGVERRDDFSKVVPEAGAGAGSAFLSGLFGGGADVLAQMSANKQAAENGGEVQGYSGPMGGTPQPEGFGGPADRAAGQGLSLEDLFALSRTGAQGL